MEVNYRMTAILIFSIALCSVCETCEVDDVAVYKVKLHLLWNGAFAENRNKEQWSQVFGQTHNRSYNLYRLGESTRSEVNDFLQFGVFNHLMENSEEELRVYDQFLAPEFNEETKVTEGLVFADGGHSFISLISRLISSSNWFIGVDSLDLCVHSSWIDEVTLDLEPLSAGFGFNEQENRPVEKLSRHNSEFSGSDSYNNQRRQAHSIVKAEFTKIKEYSTKELNELARKELLSKINFKKERNVPRWTKILKSKHVSYDEFSTKNPFETLKDLEEDPIGTPRPNNPDNHVIVVTKSPDIDDASDIDGDFKNMDEVVLTVAHGRKLGLGRHLPRHFKSRLHHAVNKHRGKNCIVSEWSSWSTCSDPCEEQTRVRTIVQEAKGGKSCPKLTEKRHCGHCVRGDGDYLW